MIGYIFKIEHFIKGGSKAGGFIIEELGLKPRRFRAAS
jgi:hypothetical protein